MSANTNNHGFFNSIATSKAIANIHDTSTSGDMIHLSKSEIEENAEFAANATLLNRIVVRSKGYQVDALNKKHDLQKNYDAGIGLDNDGGGNQELEIEAHPELPYMGGKADQIMLPESEIDAVPVSQLSSQQKSKLADKKKKQQEKERKQLSLQMKPKIQPKQAPVHRYVAPPPRHTPPKLRPPGS
jgi:hypothetical protein